MLHCKITKKYSHCQCINIQPYNHHGFFIIELVYTLLVMTSFIWVISLYLSMNIHWQQWAYNQLMALTIARDNMEHAFLEKSYQEVTFKKDQFSIEFYSKKYLLPAHIPYLQQKEIPLRVIDVAVTWQDQKGKTNTIVLESYG